MYAFASSIISSREKARRQGSVEQGGSLVQVPAAGVVALFMVSFRGRLPVTAIVRCIFDPGSATPRTRRGCRAGKAVRVEIRVVRYAARPAALLTATKVLERIVATFRPLKPGIGRQYDELGVLQVLQPDDLPIGQPASLTRLVALHVSAEFADMHRP